MRELFERATLTFDTFSLGIVLLLPASHDYGERNNVALSCAFGQALEPLDLGRMLVSDIRLLVLCGRHWLLPAWPLSAACNWAEQGRLYQRQGGRRGLRHLF